MGWAVLQAAPPPSPYPPPSSATRQMEKWDTGVACAERLPRWCSCFSNKFPTASPPLCLWRGAGRGAFYGALVVIARPPLGPFLSPSLVKSVNPMAVQLVLQVGGPLAPLQLGGAANWRAAAWGATAAVSQKGWQDAAPFLFSFLFSFSPFILVSFLGGPYFSF